MMKTWKMLTYEFDYLGYDGRVIERSAERKERENLTKDSQH